MPQQEYGNLMVVLLTDMLYAADNSHDIYMQMYKVGTPNPMCVL